MADAAAPAQAPVDPAAPAQPPPLAQLSRGAVRDARRSTAVANHPRSRSADPAASAVTSETKPAPTLAAVAAVVKPAAESAAKSEAAPEKPDPATDRGLRSIEQARKKFLDEQTAAKAELDVQRAEVARIRKEAEGKVTSLDALKKLGPTELLAALDHLSEDDFDIIARSSYARTKAGKVDPRAQTAAQDAARAAKERSASTAATAELAELRETVKQLEQKLTGEFTRRDQASFVERWVGDAVKAIPADKPTFLSKLHANEPETAKRELLSIGAELEKANDGEPPTQAEVIAEFEKRKRASLKAMGLDADALLAPPAPAKPAPVTQARTLDVTTSNLTRPAITAKTRDERRDVAVANLKARKTATADQLP